MGIEPTYAAWEKLFKNNNLQQLNNTNGLPITLDTAFVQKCDFGAAKV